MKKVALAISFALLVSLSTAQQNVNTSIKNIMEATFQDLDKSKVPTGILLDYGMELTNVPAFNGTLTDSTYVSKNTLTQIYTTLLSSRIQNVTTGFITPQQFQQHWQDERKKDTIVLSGLFFEYASFEDNAYPSKVGYTNNKFQDKYTRSGTWLNPYEVKKTFAIATPIQVFKGLNPVVTLPSTLFYSNAASQIQSVAIDFDDGNGYQTVAYNQNIALRYATSGNHIWKYRVTLTNNTMLYAHAKIHIQEALPTNPVSGTIGQNRGVTDWNCNNASLYNFMVEANIPYDGVYGTATFTLDDAGNDCEITNPLIVAEGFDVGTLLNPENEGGETDYQDFVDLIEDSNSNDLESLLLGTNKEYDIIYINWDNGVDFMQRNAYILEEVIAWVNANKTGNEKNVVLGQSMGGVIARYALADMENRNVAHDTRLFISQDAPQQGANMPLSLQHFYRQMTNQVITASQTLGGQYVFPLVDNEFGVTNYLSLLDAPATKQLLKVWTSANYVIDNTEHTAFFNELTSLNSNNGYPSLGNIRNIAISNGSECGTLQDFDAGGYLLDYEYNNGLSFWGDLLSLIYNPIGFGLGGFFADPDFFEAVLLSLLPGNSRYIVDFKAKALNNSGGSNIYSGLIRYEKKIFFIFNSQVTISSVNKNQPSGLLPFDNYGGGFYDIGVLTSNTDFEDFPGDLFIGDKFNFIPTASALDIGGGAVNLTSIDYRNSYVGGEPPTGTKSSPFDNFATAFSSINDTDNNNERHLELNTRNGNWLADELNFNSNQKGAPQTDCSIFCSLNNTIIGETSVCDFEIYALSSTNFNANWSVSPSNAGTIQSGQNTDEIVFQKNTGYSGTATITAVVSAQFCGTVIFSREIFIGSPSNLGFNGPSSVAPGHVVDYEVVNPEVGMQYLWTVPTGWEYNQLTGSSIWARPIQVGQDGDITVTATNDCGTATAALPVVVEHGGSGDPKSSVEVHPIILFPNPTDNTITIETLDESFYGSPYTIVDMFGIVKRTGILPRGSEHISLANYITGVYVLQIQNLNTVYTQQIIKR